MILELLFDLGDGFIEEGFSFWRFLVLGERQGRKESQVYDYKNPPDFTHAGDLLCLSVGIQSALYVLFSKFKKRSKKKNRYWFLKSNQVNGPGESGAEGDEDDEVAGFEVVVCDCFVECDGDGGGGGVAVLVDIDEHFFGG